MGPNEGVSEKFLKKLLKFSNFITLIIIFFLIFIFLYCLKNILIDKVVDVSFFLYSSILSLILIIFFLLTFKFNKIVRINIVLISTFSLISLYFFELFYFFNNKKFNNLNLDKTPSEKVRILKAKKNGISYDLRSRSEYIKDLKEEKIIAYPIIPPSIPNLMYEGLKVNDRKIVPLGGISNILVIGPNENGFG